MVTQGHGLRFDGFLERLALEGIVLFICLPLLFLLILGRSRRRNEDIAERIIGEQRHLLRHIYWRGVCSGVPDPSAPRDASPRPHAPRIHAIRSQRLTGVTISSSSQGSLAPRRRRRLPRARHVHHRRRGQCVHQARSPNREGRGFPASRRRPRLWQEQAPRAFLKDKQAEILEAYGLESLPGQ